MRFYVDKSSSWLVSPAPVLNSRCLPQELPSHLSTEAAVVCTGAPAVQCRVQIAAASGLTKTIFWDYWKNYV
ncbi:MAG: hypothetical protein HZA77_12340 [Candidatus Schekmanbacteria bacterium]|nr:hypothetical protein [Candidatus Schekmanbacteria bacterium]